MKVKLSLIVEALDRANVDEIYGNIMHDRERLEKENEGIVKSGRTHLQDATPISFSQEISG